VPIHPWLSERFALVRDIPSVPAALTDPVLGAKLQQYLIDPEPWTMPAGVTAEDTLIGDVRAMVFRPAEPNGSALLWMHGGGFVIGSVDDTESVIPSAELASRSGAVVVSLGYRLAVDGVRFPAPLDDAMAGWRWLAGQGFDRVFAGGASVGATLATGIAVRLRDAGEPLPAGLLLAYPIEHYPVPAATLDLSDVPAMLRFPLEYQAGIVHNYAGTLDDLPADAVPGNHDVAGLPEAWIAPAEYDDLRPSAELFATQLEAAGIPVRLRLAEGMTHGFLGRGPSLEPVDETLDFFAGALR
jgi:acetyl esterase